MNKHKFLFISLQLVNFIFYSASASKLWIEEPDFDDANTWQSGYLPCSHDEIIFPESYSSAILLASTIDTTGITLPQDGALLLRPNSKITFSSGISNGRKCENFNQRAEVKAVSSRHWFDPHNWRDISKEATGSTSSQNPAVPHIERVPCNNESVRIPATGAISIDLSYVRTLRVGEVNFAGSDVSSEYLEQLFKTELGEIIFKDTSLTKVEYYNEPVCGCHKPDIILETEGNVCHHVQGLCEDLKCLTPILPYGHCCPICGVMLKVIVDKCDSSYPEKLSRMIKISLKDQDMEEQLDYHVSFVDAGVSIYLQAVILDKDNYEERSVKFMHRFNESVIWDVFQNKKKEFFTSGRPYNPNGFGAALLLMLVTLLGVLAFFTVVFVNFASENEFIRLPRWMHVRWYDIFQSPFVFARFDNTAPADGDTAENVIIDVQQYNVSAEFPERTEGTSTSFDNPMFLENPLDREAIQDVVDEDIPLHEEDLTDIDLETEIEGRL